MANSALWALLPSLHINTRCINMHINAYVITHDTIRLEVLTSVTYEESGGSSQVHRCVCDTAFPNRLACKGVRQKVCEFCDASHFENV